jgi:photosystem II stability/assembly factor-like uncharacterized protein
LTQSNWEVIETVFEEDLHDIEFINDSVGFVYGYGTGNIYRTSDAGLHWELVHQTDPIYLEQIQFVNPDHGWICGEYGTLLMTEDGGRIWEDISMTCEEGNLLLYGMYFLNDTTGYISGGILSGKKLSPVFFKTGNGGNSWIQIFGDIPHMILNITNKGNALFGTGTGCIIKMEAQKGSWEYAFKDTIGVIGQIRELRFIDDDLGIAASFNGYLLITKDGGKSFSYKKITKNRLRGIIASNEHEWIAVGDNNKDDGGVLFTSNYLGRSWNKHNEFPDIHRVTMTEKYFWIAGKKGFIARGEK